MMMKINLFCVMLLLGLAHSFLNAQNLQSDSIDYTRFAEAHHLDSGELRRYVAHDHNTTAAMVMRQPGENGAPLFIGNSGFENGNYSNWNCYIGENVYHCLSPFLNTQYVAAMGPFDPSPTNQNARHSIVTSATGNDSVGGFPTLPMGYGNYTARLGSLEGTYYGQYIEQSWVVSPADTMLLVSYAVVIENGAHNYGENTYFSYMISDNVNGDTIIFRQDESSILPPVYTLASNATYFFPWQTDTFDVSAYLGLTLTIRFTTAGCIWGGHNVYAYVDCDPAGTTSSVHETTSQTGLSVSPNPSVNGIYNLVCSSEASEPAIFDLSGRKINAQYIQTAFGWIIDISQSPKGTYFVQILTPEGVKHCSLIH